MNIAELEVIDTIIIGQNKGWKQKPSKLQTQLQMRRPQKVLV